jgi:chloramphenicol-sensitive protein RarD
MLLMCGGVITVLPLIWFSKAIQILPLSIIGLFQYIAPTLQLLVGVFIYHEEFGPTHLLSFGLIWFGLFVYTADQLWKSRKGIWKKVRN